MSELKNIPTKQLIEELLGRDGVKKVILQPYEKGTIKAEGPSIVLVVID